MLKIATILVLSAGTAEALCPPAQWDYPYRGKLTISHDVQARCPPPSVFGARVVGCAFVGKGRCHVVVIPGSDCALRHEIAHCNGWPADHR